MMVQALGTALLLSGLWQTLMGRTEMQAPVPVCLWAVLGSWSEFVGSLSPYSLGTLPARGVNLCQQKTWHEPLEPIEWKTEPPLQHQSQPSPPYKNFRQVILQLST